MSTVKSPGQPELSKGILRVNFILTAMVLCLSVLCGHTGKPANPGDDPAESIRGPVKVKDIIIYKDAWFYSAFPSVVKRPDGEILLGFRRAPERKIFGEPGSSHVDPNSYLVIMRSADGETWSEPSLLYAHPFGGSQDPCLLQLSDGTLICTSYGWALVRPEGIPNLKTPNFQTGGHIFLGGYTVRSDDGGKTWQGPFYPPNIAPEINYNAYGIPLPAYNRGALYEGSSGRLFWVVAASDSRQVRKTSTHLLISEDGGLTWEYSAPVAEDESISFNEASVYETPAGDIVAFLRTANFNDHACIARSADGGKTFGKWESMGFRGHPLHALRLSDNRVLLVYGYRHKPFGIRARILNEECDDFATAPEIILRDDGGNGDIGYPWSVQLDDGRVLVVYYFNNDNGTRYIAGTILDL
jgi:sialidase-1